MTRCFLDLLPIYAYLLCLLCLWFGRVSALFILLLCGYCVFVLTMGGYLISRLAADFRYFPAALPSTHVDVLLSCDFAQCTCLMIVSSVGCDQAYCSCGQIPDAGTSSALDSIFRLLLCLNRSLSPPKNKREGTMKIQYKNFMLNSSPWKVSCSRQFQALVGQC